MLARWRVVVAMVVVVACLPGSFAIAADDKAAARDAYHEGTRLFDVGEFARALGAFKRAYVSFEDPAFLFNIAQCHRNLGNKAEALRTYRTYLLRSPRADNRGEVERIIETLETALAAESRSRAGPPVGTMAPTRTTAAPPHAAEPAPPPGTSAAPHQPPAVAAAALAAPAPSPAKPVYKRAWFWAVIGGVVAAGVAVGVGVGVGTAQSSGPATTLPTWKL